MDTDGVIDVEKLTLKYRNRLAIAANELDQELSHMDADEALCDLLVELGFSLVVQDYLAIPKWFA